MYLAHGANERLFLFALTELPCAPEQPGRATRDYNRKTPMVRDGYIYAATLIVAAVLLGWLTSPAWTLIPVLLGCFFLWFFRDPERVIPQDAGAVVSPADGKVTDVSTLTTENAKQTRISIFLSVFDVHVNRSPVAGVVRDVRYQTGKFLNAMNTASADLNEQNIVTLEGDGQRAVFRQI